MIGRRLRARPLLVALALGATACAGGSSPEEHPVAPGTDDVDQVEAVDPEITQRYSEAAQRTEVPIVGTAEVPLPTPGAAAAPVGESPELVLGPTIEMAPPSALADPAGPGPVLVSTVEGRVLTVDLQDGATQVVMDLRDRISVGGERGLLGMALDPAGDRLYLDFTNAEGDTEIRSWPVGDDGMPVAAGPGVLHLRIGQPDPAHNAGNLVFGPDGALWIATGDGGGFGDPGGVAQDEDSLLGKVLRVLPDPQGGVRLLPSNPDWDRPEVWGIGLRNPWRWSFDRATNRLWIADVGQNAVEEVTVVDPDEEGANFGWDHVEGWRPFDGEPSERFLEPAIAYGRDDGCSVTGGYVYRGTQNPGLHGWYVFGDFCGRWIRAVPSTDPQADPVELISTISSVVSFGELEDGELVALTAAGIQPLLPPPG